MRAILLVCLFLLTACAAPAAPPVYPMIDNVVPGGLPPTELPISSFPNCSPGCVEIDGKLVPRRQ